MSREIEVLPPTLLADELIHWLVKVSIRKGVNIAVMASMVEVFIVV